MSKHSWHIARQGEEPKEVRHYKHLTKMYSFILRNPAMFGGRTLTVYDNGQKVADVEWEDILVQFDNKELEARKWLKSKCKN